MTSKNWAERRRDELIADYAAGKIELVDLANNMFDIGFVDSLRNRSEKGTPQDFIKIVRDFDDLDSIQMYTILQNANELLKYLYESEGNFPGDIYQSGTAAMKKAMAYVDDVFIHPEE